MYILLDSKKVLRVIGNSILESTDFNNDLEGGNIRAG